MVCWCIFEGVERAAKRPAGHKGDSLIWYPCAANHLTYRAYFPARAPSAHDAAVLILRVKMISVVISMSF